MSYIVTHIQITFYNITFFCLYQCLWHVWKQGNIIWSPIEKHTHFSVECECTKYFPFRSLLQSTKLCLSNNWYVMPHYIIPAYLLISQQSCMVPRHTQECHKIITLCEENMHSPFGQFCKLQTWVGVSSTPKIPCSGINMILVW